MRRTLSLSLLKEQRSRRENSLLHTQRTMNSEKYVVILFILDVRQEEGHTRGIRSHKISPASFCGTCLNIYRKNDLLSLVDREVEFCVPTN